MKKNLILLAAAGCLALTSCSSDNDDNGGNNNLTADLTGSYQLTSATAPNAQDYDGDGDSSANLALEGSCYQSSWIAFHDDGTYDEEITRSTQGSGGLTLDCETEASSGTYTQNGSTVTTTRTAGTGDATATYTFNSSQRILTRTESNASYRGLNVVSQLWANLTGNISYTFTKYSDNDDDNGVHLNITDNNLNNTTNAELLGNFNLTSYLVGQAQDLDHDGNSSSNLVNETDCYGNSGIVFHNDGTYEETISTSTIGSLGLSLDCDTTTHLGRWSRSGNTITMTDLSSSAHTSTSFTLNSTAHTLTRTQQNGQYPGFNSVTSIFANLSSNIDYTFTKN